LRRHARRGNLRERPHLQEKGNVPVIATLTPNPSIDLLFETDRLVWEDANRVDPPRRRAGGQGINVVRAARALGGEAVAIAPLGGGAGRELRAMLEAEGTPLRAVEIEGETRVFFGVRERESGRSLLVNPRGPVLSAEDAARMLEETARTLQQDAPRWLACCGSLARGLAPDFYARARELARACGTAFLPDCDGEALRLAAEPGCDLLVPNEHEAARLLGREGLEPEDAPEAAAALRRWAPLTCITMGRRGAVCAGEAGVWRASPPAVPSGSAVGAGDAFLAAFLLSVDAGADAPAALRRAVAAGTAVLLSFGSDLLLPGDAEALEAEVRLERVR
jgi:1-phosphofructokinase family hexose kinase